MEHTNKNIQKRFDEAYNETLHQLNTNGRCAIVRPTGFGKTMVMCKIAQLPRYKRVLYVYPTRIVREHAAKLLTNTEKVHYISYSAIGKYRSNLPSLFKQISGVYELIIFDELHHIGAKNVKYVVENLLDSLDTSQTHILGGTATPKRMDGYDVIDKFFDNSVISFYGLDDAIKDKIIPEPYYIYAADSIKVLLGETEKKIKKALESGGLSEFQIEELRVNLRKRKEQLDLIMNAPRIISQYTSEVYSGKLPSYMRFMAFFITKEILDNKSKEVYAWFKSAFPLYNIRTLTVYSEAEEKENVLRLAKLGTPSNTIDLIFSINMLNEGYHIDGMTGIVLLRPTQSPIIYSQQVGRGMQVGMDHNPIILDFISNIKAKSLFNTNVAPIIDKAVNGAELKDQLSALEYVDKKHVHIVDVIAEADEIIDKLNETIPTTGDNMILDMRIKNSAPAYIIAKATGVELWRVLAILLRYNTKLEELGLQVQEADRYKRGQQLGELVDNFDSYWKKAQSIMQ